MTTDKYAPDLDKAEDALIAATGAGRRSACRSAMTPSGSRARPSRSPRPLRATPAGRRAGAPPVVPYGLVVESVNVSALP